ncbi:MAG: XRE family transcriptional regulator [Gammaproteobacteria bacterium]|nr:XRE family transcriptional regulator [Gammaproteobacteria bacterium]NNJ85008.1 XRE family transcriptional regulator [Gammaproteobacteria bacterium]
MTIDLNETWNTLAPKFNLARELLAARPRVDLNRQEVAKRMGISQSTVACLAGAYKPFPQSLGRYAESVGMKAGVNLVSAGV